MASEKLAAETETTSEENAISMVDVLREEEELEADATAVLGDSDVHNCTYPMGYISRQALYACLTCKTTQPAGVCLACSYDCHEGHDLCELYTKRNFRCDCGGDKFEDQRCKLFPGKTEANSKNKYNQNFNGLYCTCSRPYPDPDDEVEDEMIQCVFCEDWYHGRHLGTDCNKLPDEDDYDEMTCPGCVSKIEFLWAYNVQSKENQKLDKDDSKTVVDVEVEKQESDNPQGSASKPESDTKSDTKSDPISDSKSDIKVDDKAPQPGSSSKGSKSDDDRTDVVDASTYCQLKELQKREIKMKDSALFWKEGWRGKLCRCEKCMEMYSEREVLFLIDDADTVKAYESRGKEKSTPSSQYDKGLQALSNMDRVQQVEVLQGFNDLKSELSEYLKKFAENGKVVREEDIREFFSRMEARKRQRTVGPMQYFCK